MFSICEEPLVISGSKCLGFYWNGDQLYTKSNSYSENTLGWTHICLELREPLEIPDFDEFGQFLCKSLLFTYSLSAISMIVDGKVELKCSKLLSPHSSLNFSKFKNPNRHPKNHRICRIGRKITSTRNVSRFSKTFSCIGVREDLIEIR